MLPTKQGSIRLFTFSGIDVFLHWSWLLVAIFEIQNRQGRYPSLAWNVIEYLALFLIVLLHEFGHSLACRQVGGRADQIVLWPFGGVAYVQPPPRPGAVLWSIAAGPLVNVVLFVILTGVLVVTGDVRASGSDLGELLRAIWTINTGLLIFNLLPIYPLDGGQIMQSLLWFWLGRGRSLMVASIIGFIGVAVLALIAILGSSIWIGLIAAFVGMNCWRGFVTARAMLDADKVPRHTNLHCPTCQASPPAGEYWKCGECGTAFDLFDNRGRCPNCACRFATSRCPFCGNTHEVESYSGSEKV